MAGATVSTGADWFEPHRRELQALAYRMLGTWSDVDDVVQDAFLRVRDGASLDDPRTYLRRIVTRLCLDRVKSARARREQYVGFWLPEPVIGAELEWETSPVEQQQDVSFALMLMLQRLSPLERAAFILRDVFDADYSEIADALDRSEQACRQLASRARTQVRALRSRYQPTQAQIDDVLAAFLQASQTGDPAPLRAVLTSDALLLTDSGGKVPSARNPIEGAENIARFVVGASSKWPLVPPVSIEQTVVNGLPGFVIRQAGEPRVAVLAIDLCDDGVRTVYQIRNPEKLTRLAR